MSNRRKIIFSLGSSVITWEMQDLDLASSLPLLLYSWPGKHQGGALSESASDCNSQKGLCRVLFLMLLIFILIYDTKMKNAYRVC